MSKRRVAAFVVAALAVGLMLALPTSALAARATTRLVVSKSSFTVNNTNSSVVPTAPVVTVKLQKKRSTSWVAISGKVKLYRYDDLKGQWTYVTAKTGSSVSFSLTKAALYKAYYAGGTTTLSSRAYTRRYDNVVNKYNVTAQVLSADATYATVKVTTDVSWNTSATAAEAAFSLYGTFYSSDPMVDIEAEEGTSVLFLQSYKKPGVYATTVTVRVEDLLPILMTEHGLMFSDDYIKEFGGSDSFSMVLPL